MPAILYAVNALEEAARSQDAQAEELERRAAVLRRNAVDYRAAQSCEKWCGNANCYIDYDRYSCMKSTEGERPMNGENNVLRR